MGGGRAAGLWRPWRRRQGSLLVVHALSIAEPVEVWLVGEAAPIATGLESGDAVRIADVERDARRVVLTLAGTQELNLDAWPSSQSPLLTVCS